MRLGAVAAALSAFAVIALSGQETLACGQTSDCQVNGGFYRIHMPEGRAADAMVGEKVGAIVFFHGHRGWAEGVMNNKALLKEADALGVALVAPHGMRRTWSFPGAPSKNRDELAFVEAVTADMLARFPIREDRIMASGFSAGGSMTWSLACAGRGGFAGYAPVAGAFWIPLPEACARDRPLALFHVHGTSDRVVPLAGRPIGSIAHQGDTFKSFEVLLQGAMPPSRTLREGRFDCRRWSTGNRDELELCLHEGGHEFRSEWVSRGWRRLAAAKGWAG